MAYRVIDKETYYRKDVFRRFSEDCKCSLSMTARIDVTDLVAWSKRTGTKFYLNFLYLLSRVMNAREDYRMDYFYKTGELVVYDVIHPTHYAFHPETETCTPVYSTYMADYDAFYRGAAADLARAKADPVYIPEATQLPNSPGCPTTPSIWNCRTGTSTSPPSSTGGPIGRKGAGSRCPCPSA